MCNSGQRKPHGEKHLLNRHPDLSKVTRHQYLLYRYRCECLLIKNKIIVNTMSDKFIFKYAAKTIALPALCLIAFDSIAQTDNLLKPHTGYQWVKIKELHSTFLKPASWAHHISKGKLMSSLIFNEQSSASSDSAAKFTVNVISNLTQTNYQPISKQLKQYAGNLSKRADLQVTFRENISRGSYTGESITLKYMLDTSEQTKTSANLPEFRMEQRHYLANDSRDWLMVISFQSNQSNWQRLQPVREKLLNSYLLH